MTTRRPFMATLLVLVGAGAVVATISAYSLPEGIAAGVIMGYVGFAVGTAVEIASLDFGAMRDGKLPPMWNVIIVVSCLLLVTVIAAENLTAEASAGLYGAFIGGLGSIANVVRKRYRTALGQPEEDE